MSNSKYLPGLGLTLWYTGFELQKTQTAFSALGFISVYIEIGLENRSDYFTGVRFKVGLSRLKNFLPN